MAKRIKISLATKFAFAFASLFIVTMLVVMYAVRETVVNRFTQEYEREVKATVHTMRLILESRQETISERLRQFARKIAEDNDFRLHALVLKDVYNPFLLDYAGEYMSAMGLQVLEITNSQGVVLSSAHNRNSFGKQVRSLITRLRALDGEGALVWFDRVGRGLLCLTAIESVRVGEETLFLVGGTEITPTFLRELQANSSNIVLVQLTTYAISSAPGKVEAVLASLSENDGVISPADEFERRYSIGEIALPFVSAAGISEAIIYLLFPRTGLEELLIDLNRRGLIITSFGLAIAILLAILLTRSVAKPLKKLAYVANTLSFDKLHGRFDLAGNDEVGVLNEALRNMLKRLRLSRMKLSAAERKAALIEVSRQVNHDIRNAFVPIRKVMEHWQEVADRQSESLTTIFNERKATVFESLDYLENLARNYSRLHSDSKTSQVNVNEVLRHLLKNYQDLQDDNIHFKVRLDAQEPSVLADETQLRRAFENVVHNAIEAMTQGGDIFVTSALENGHVKVIFEDTGSGIPKNVLAELFQKSISTKEGGSGIGLMNVKRIVQDLGGTVTVDSDGASGTSVTMTLPKQQV